MSWNDQLRQAARHDPRSVYALARDSALRVSQLQRFLANEHGLTMNSAEKLAAALGTVELRVVRRRKGS